MVFLMIQAHLKILARMPGCLSLSVPQTITAQYTNDLQEQMDFYTAQNNNVHVKDVFFCLFLCVVFALVLEYSRCLGSSMARQVSVNIGCLCDLL